MFEEFANLTSPDAPKFTGSMKTIQEKIRYPVMNTFVEIEHEVRKFVIERKTLLENEIDLCIRRFEPRVNMVRRMFDTSIETD